jgi:hypothetical protein
MLIHIIVRLLESHRNVREKINNAILIIFYRYIKAALYFKCREILDTARVAMIIVRNLMLCGARVPESVISDHGPLSSLKFWAVFCYHVCISRQLRTAYHPLTDSDTEQQNQTIQLYPGANINYQQDD